MLKFLNKKEIKIFFTFFILYSYFVFWPGTNENTRFFLTRAIVDEGRLEIDSYVNQTGDRAYINGHYYSEKAPGSSFLAVPVYATWKFLYFNFFPQEFKESHAGSNEYLTTYIINSTRNSAKVEEVSIITQVNPGFFVLTSLISITVLTSSLFSALGVVLMYKISKYFTNIERHRILLTITYAIATGTFPYALIFNGQAIGTFFAFLGFYLIFKVKKEKLDNRNYLFFAGLATGIAFITEYLLGILIFFFLVIIMTLKNRRNKTLFFILGLILGLSLLLVYNYLILGNPFQLTRSFLDPKIYPDYYREKFGFIYNVNPFIMFRSLFYPYRGLFYYYPILLLSVFGFYLMYKKYKIETIFILFSFIFFTVFLSTLFNWAGGSIFGPRYISVLTPFLVLPLIFVFEKRDKNYVLLFFSMLFLLISIFNNFLGIQNPEHIILEAHGIETSPYYKSLENTFQIMYDPIREHYLPLFWEYGPRSRIFENLSNGYMDIDIRLNPYSKGYEYCCFPFFPKDTFFFIRFLSLVPVSLLIFLIWYIKPKKIMKIFNVVFKCKKTRKYIRKFDIKKINFILLLIILIISFLIFINYLYLAFTNLSYPYDLQFDEGGFFVNTLLLYEGNLNELYHDVHEEPLFFSNDNPPIFYFFSASLFPLLGKTLMAGRIISILASFGIAFIIYKILKKRTKDTILSIVFSLLFFSTYIIFYWAPIMRSDTLALLFSLAGIYFILDYKKRSNIYLASLFFILSAYTRQTYIVAPIATFIYLFFNDRKTSFNFLKIFLIPSIVIFLILTFLTNGQFFTSVITQNTLIGNIYAPLHLNQIFKAYFFPFSLSVIFVFRNRKDIFSIYFLLVLAFAVMQSFKTGGWIQYFIEATTVALIPVALLYKKEKSSIFSAIPLLFLLVHLCIMIFSNPCLISTISQPDKCAAIKNLDADQKLYQYVKNTQGNALIDHRYLTFLAGKKITPEIFGIYELERLSEIRPEEIQDYIENNNITLIAYRNQFIEKDPFWQSHMQKNYELIDTITYYDYVNVNVWKIYSKR